MKKMRCYYLFLCIFLLLDAVKSHAQDTEAIRPDIRLDTVAMPRFNFSGLGSKQAFLQMDYGRSQILNPSTVATLSGLVVEKVQLVFTRFPKSTNLSKLNKARIDSLYAIWPALFEDGLVQWELVEQTACPSEAVAESLFHGFVINYREPASYAGSMSGAKKMELLMEGRIKPQDSTILRIMERNKEWSDILVVADLTGSMSPYIGQLLLWLKLNAKSRPAKYFVFFNDGDEKSDFEKEIGNTGGIYHTDAEDIRVILELAKETMRNGYGGDEPENNLEAVLFGMKQYPNFKEIVMIADNWATPRDMLLVTQVGVPVRVVLCGTEKGLNPRYLDLARRTKGSVHTIEDDISTLMELSEGESIQVGEHLYRIERGKFKLVR